MNQFPAFFALRIGVVLLALSGCGTGAREGGGASPGALQDKQPARGAEAYTETIPGTVVSFEMLPIPAGWTTVTTPDGAQEVAIGPFWMSRIEIPWDVYDIYVYGLDQSGSEEAAAGADAVSRPSKPYVLPGESFGHQGRPALAMTYHAAEQFTRWLSAKTGRKYRLPTEAEWEYACRANAPEPSEELGEFAWYRDNAGERTHPGASRRPNAFGLSDMLGNVAEWVTGVDGDPVVKGGSFLDAAADVHCGARRKQTPAWNATDPQLPKSRWWLPDAPFVGFRIVREP